MDMIVSTGRRLRRLSAWAIFSATGLFSASCLAQSPLNAEYVAKGEFPGASFDLSGLEGMLETDTPANQLGGFSAIEYSGQGNRYFVLSDRGPGNGAASYASRFHAIDLEINLVEKTIRPQLVTTFLMRSKAGVAFNGLFAALQRKMDGGGTQALDAEGIRLVDGKTLLISDEYGPSVSLFSLDGRRVMSARVPSAFALCSNPEAKDACGTFLNRGLEGLAISADRQSFVAAMQGPLVQDGKVVENKCLGLNTRWIVFNRDLQASQQWVYPLSDESTGVSEILAVDNTRYLVIERDGTMGADARIKHIYLVESKAASDVSGVASLGRHDLPEGIVPTQKTLLIDLLDERYGLGGANAAEKPEGLCWGPDLPDGRRLLLICVDNDFDVTRASQFYAFAIGM